MTTWRCQMPRTMTGGQISPGPGSQQLTRPVSLILILFLNCNNLLRISRSLLACFFKFLQTPSCSPSPTSVPHMTQPVTQESKGGRMCSFCLVTASSTSAVWLPFVSKHLGAVLLLAARWPMLLTFNEFLIFAMLPPLL